jgi:SNF2 family DNA or RNA helicase
MVVQKAMLEGLQRFLNSMGFQSLDRAKCSSRGSVLEVDCVEPDHLYSARVPGERVYEVQLEFANGKWEAKCSCPVAARCKHIAAAMLALEERESDNSEPRVSDRKRIAALMKKHWQKVQEAAVKLLPSPLLDKVVAHLGRDLRPREAAFLRVVHSSFATGPRPFTTRRWSMRSCIWPRPPRFPRSKICSNRSWRGGHKVLVFSQFVTMLDLLREAVNKHEWPHFCLAGATDNRGKLVETFQSAEGQELRAMSLRALRTATNISSLRLTNVKNISASAM